MRIALVGHGALPIPPVGWGAVESVIWEYAVRLRDLGHEVHIVNEKKRKVAPAIRALGPLDFIHCHNDRAVPFAVWAGFLKRARVAATSHYAIPWDAMEPDHRRVLRATSRARHQLPLTERFAAELTRLNPLAKVRVMANGCEFAQFRFQATHNGRAICVGRIGKRKRQDAVHRALHAAGLKVDFVGPIDDLALPPDASVLGEWDRPVLRERLTEYACLVLYSHAEAHPLVVCEALAAGVPVVVSPASAAHLDPSLPFVHVATSEAELVEGVRRAQSATREVREAARAFAEERFDWDKIVRAYVTQLEEWSS